MAVMDNQLQDAPNTAQTDAGAAQVAADTAPKVPVKRGTFAQKTSEWPNVTWTWADGEVNTYDVTTFPEEVVRQATLHGFKQKGGDSYASAKSLIEAKGMFQKVMDALATGWTVRTPSAEQEDPVEMLAQAVFNALTEYAKESGKVAPDFDTVLAKVTGAEPAERRNFKKDPKVSYHIAAAKAKSAESPLAAFGM